MSNRLFDQLSANAQIALTEFPTEFMAALSSMPEGWGRMLGRVRSSAAPRTRWPISLSTAGYTELLGDIKYRSLEHTHIELIHKKFQDGVSELKTVVDAPDFFGWDDEPMKMAAALSALPNELVDAALTANANAFDGNAFFSGAHPYNMLDVGLGTFANTYPGSAISIATLASMKTRFRAIRAANGKNMGLRLTHILVHPTNEQAWLDIVAPEFRVIDNAALDSITSIDNRHRNSVQIVVGDELATAGTYFPMALNKTQLGLYPWLLAEGDREDRVLDTSSAMYETKLKIGFDSFQDMEAGLAFPQVLHRYVV